MRQKPSWNVDGDQNCWSWPLWEAMKSLNGNPVLPQYHFVFQSNPPDLSNNMIPSRAAQRYLCHNGCRIHAANWTIVCFAAFLTRSWWKCQDFVLEECEQKTDWSHVAQNMEQSGSCSYWGLRNHVLVAALRGLHSSFLPLGARTDAISRGHGEYVSHSV